jgi:hypothetical protein
MTPPAPVEVHFAMSELEEILRGPDAAETWVIVMQRLAELQNEWSKAAKTGLSSKDFEVVEKTIKAIATGAFKPKDVKLGGTTR